MNLAFAGFRHSHIFGLYESAKNNPRVNIRGCFEEHSDTRLAVEKEHGITFDCATYDEILKDTQVDAVAIGDCYGKRGNLAIKALEAGKHIILDKPVCTTLSELEQIEKLSKEKNLVVCCMLDLRYLLHAEKLRELVAKGEIGEVKTVGFTGQHPLNYGVRPMWYFEEGMHGGTINDIAIHGVDLVSYVTGKRLTSTDYAKCWNAYAIKEPQFKDCGQFVAKFDDMTLSADVSYAAPNYKGILPTYWDFNFWGTEGLIKISLADGNIHIYKEEETIIECAEGKLEYLDAFCDEIEGKTTMMTTQSVLASARDTLTIQKYADEK